MPNDAGQVSGAAGSSARDEGNPSIRQRILSAWDRIIPQAGPVQWRDPANAATVNGTAYSPLQAAQIAAGASLSAIPDRAKSLYQGGAAKLAEYGGDQETANRMRELAAQTNQKMADDGGLYQPLQDAFPIASAVGEMAGPVALGALMAGVPGAASAARSRLATSGVGAAAQELAQQLQNSRLWAIGKTVRGY